MQPALPRKLAIVVDGSEAMGKQVEQLTNVLNQVPSNVSAQLIVAGSHEPISKPLTRESIEGLRHYNFVGGCSNAAALIEAKKFLVQGNRGAVLWLHGTQPLYKIWQPTANASENSTNGFTTSSTDLNILMKRGERRLTVFDYALSAGDMNNVKDSLIQVDRDACPNFKEVFHTGNMEKDLKVF